VSDVQGVGKTTLGGSILTPLVGRHNTAFPTEKMLVESQFNGWAAHKRLAVVNEVYAGHSRKGYDNTKSIVTDMEISVNEKFMPVYVIDNWCHIFACSNSLSALHLDSDDRRWFVPAITSELREKEYWMYFHQWLREKGGLGIIKTYLADFVKKHGAVDEASHAPSSETKETMIEMSLSDGQRIAKDLAVAALREYRDTGRKMIFCVDDVYSYVRQVRTMNRSEAYLEKRTTLLSALVRGGMHRPMKKTEEGRTWRAKVLKDSLNPAAGKVMADVVANFLMSSEMCESYVVEELRVNYEQLGSIC
jgi:hypothetical protein